MYQIAYNLAIRAYALIVGIASFFNPKAKSWKKGRRNIWVRMESVLVPGDELIWFHAASLGEAEQAVPIIQSVRTSHPNHKIFLTFFSPSGMDHFKRKDLVDYVFYLPSDTPANARRFVELVNPRLAVFIKYEIWANYFQALNRKAIPLILAPAIFRPDQFYFAKPHRSFFIPILQKVDRILTQDEASVELLQKNGIRNSFKVGDTRFEKVRQNTELELKDDILNGFAIGRKVMVCGSTWEADERLILNLADAEPELKLIIAPHDISKNNVSRIRRLLGNGRTFLHSSKNLEAGKQILIIDNIGMLSRLYRLGGISFVGGAFGSGIHNTLEAAAYGTPVFFGPKHQNFIEPSQMIQEGFGHEVSNGMELIQGVSALLRNEDQLKSESEAALHYILQGSGATEKIMKEVNTLLDKG